MNHGSVVVRVVFGNVAFLLAGDAESAAEQEILDRGHPLKAQVLRWDPTGRQSRPQNRSFGRSTPEGAIFSAGADNSSGNPHSEVIARLVWMGIDVYDTDRRGTIQVITDGSTFQVQTERAD